MINCWPKARIYGEAPINECVVDLNAHPMLLRYGYINAPKGVCLKGMNGCKDMIVIVSFQKVAKQIGFKLSPTMVSGTSEV